MVQSMLTSLRRAIAPHYRALRGRWIDGVSELRLQAGQERTALASYPRSGNTWLRAMIEEATGEETGSIYRNEPLSRGLEGIVIKTHETDGHRYSKAVHLIRHPMDALYSHFRWKHEIAGVHPTWEEHLASAIPRWRSHTEHWDDHSNPALVVRFEDMKEQPKNELARVLNHLDRPYADADLSRAVERTRIEKMRKSAPREIADKFFRKGMTGDGRDAFNQNDRRKLVDELSPLLARFDYTVETIEAKTR